MPWCKKQEMHIDAAMADHTVYRITLRVPLSRVGKHGTPQVSTQFFLDLKEYRMGLAESPTIRQDICPARVTIDPKEFKHENTEFVICSLKEMAYSLCLSGTSVITAQRIDLENWERYSIIDAEYAGFEYFLISVKMPIAILQDRDQWLKDAT